MKVLDFGLAKAFEDTSPGGGRSVHLTDIDARSAHGGQ